ncbi:MAG TPA: tRNA (adenosine(37)-N6)-dimethylallyltransferase MiaA [Nitrospirae bacterium]|nr:tRNA (adenosine(37)-N6)-dimethylallyltransferase MiaA [Nitrospirota bacterium]
MKKVILILGPTAVGKTALSIKLAQKLNTEIISADSMQIYKHMDIGTAKPSKEELSIVKHHMIDIIEPYEYFSVGDYIEQVIPIINRLHYQDKIPILTGGTGLYMKAMTRGLFKGPEADKKLREKLLKGEESQQGILYNYLQSIDPISAQKIQPNDKRRILRAIEVYIKTKTTISDIQTNLTIPLPYEFIKIGLTAPRQRLYERINQRVDDMIKNNLFEEVRKVVKIILERKPHHSSSIDEMQYLLTFTSMQAIGYKEIIMMEYGLNDKESTISLIKQRTRNYAKRQFTWFRAERDIIWFDSFKEGSIDEIIWQVFTL